jgi:1-acyl-sn-glycerol-3-phosphate acyltransferase
MRVKFGDNRWYQAVYWIGYPLVRSFLGFRVTGVEHFPAEGGVIAAVNHCSNADPVLVGMGCPRRLASLGKIELFRNPLFGGLLRRLGAIPLNRGAADAGALKAASAVLESGTALLLFPEGTRSRTGKLKKGRRGAAMLSVRCRVPILPMHLSGTFRMFRHLFTRRVILNIGTPLDPAAYAGLGLHSKALTARISEDTMARIKELQDGNHH